MNLNVENATRTTSRMIYLQTSLAAGGKNKSKIKHGEIL